MLVEELDFRIIRAILMGEDYWTTNRVSVASIAKQLDVHPNTVHTHVKKLSDHKFFLPPAAMVDPAPLGIYASRAFYPLPLEKRTAAAEAALFDVDGLHSVFQYLDGWDVNVFAEDPEGIASRLRLCQAVLGAPSMELETPMRPEGPVPSRARLGDMDLRVAVELLENQRAPLSQVSARVGATVRTVERRLGKLQKDGVLRAFPRLECDAEGAVVGYLRADYGASGSAAVWASLLNAIPRHFGRGRMRSRSWFWVYGASIAEVEQAAGRARGVAGVTSVRLRFVLRIHHNPGFVPWLTRVLKRRLGDATG